MAKPRYWSVRAAGATRRRRPDAIRAATGRCPGRWTGGAERDKLPPNLLRGASQEQAMSDFTTKPRIDTRPKTQRPRLHKVILLNDDYTPREFVVVVLKGEFRMSEDEAHRVMMTAHRRGVCVIAVYPKEVAETKATRATDAARKLGYPLLFTTEPEET
jgi:ATP-dependent Clp protease adaptor protein ClpS